MNRARRPRLPGAYWTLWTGYLANRLGLLSPGFLALYLVGEHVATGGQVAVAIAGYGAGLVGGGLIGGLIADRIGPKRTLWTSQALASVTSVGLMVVRDPWLIIVVAILNGVLTGFPRSAAFGLAAHLTPPEHRVYAYGQLYWGTSLGTSVSALLAGVLLNLWPPSMFLPGAISAAAFAGITLALPTVPVEPRTRRRSGLLIDTIRPFTSRCVGPFLLVAFVLSCVYMQRQSTMPLEMHRNGLSYAQLGLLLSFSALLVVVVQPFSGHVTDRLRPGHSLALSCALIGLGFGFNLLASNMVTYGIGVTTWTFGEILLVPIAAAFMADHAPVGAASTYQGAYAFVWTLGFTVGAPGGTILLTAAGPALLWTVTLIIGLALASAQLLLATRCRWLGALPRSRRQPAELAVAQVD